MARNTQLLLLEESHIGRVLDPAGGSWFVEDLTAALAEQAWAHFQRRSRPAAGSRGSRPTICRRRSREVREQPRDDIAHRRTAVTGVNEYPEPRGGAAAATLLRARAGVQRYAAGFEALRDRSDAYLAEHGSRPTALLLPLGPLAEHNIRTTFAANLLASGGIETVNPGTVDAAGVAQAVTDAPAPSRRRDLRHRRALREPRRRTWSTRPHAAASRTSISAGPEKAVADAANKPDEYLTAKIDAIAALSTLLTRLGA